MHEAQHPLPRQLALDAASKKRRLNETYRLTPGSLLGDLQASADDAERAVVGLWQRDPRTWSADEAVHQAIANRLGWLDSPELMAGARDRLLEFASAVRRDGFTDVVLLGMGGSSLAPEVLRAVVGVEPGWARLHMLDSTDPDAIRAASTPPEQTLYLLASKSGTTIEPNSLAAHFQQRMQSAGVVRWADHFVAITDEGTALAARAREQRFRDLFINPSAIGGRYSALSYFGLVPAALMGQDITALIGWGLAMLSAAAPEGPISSNLAAALGLALGAAAKAGRDKVTLIMPTSLEPFGLWIEQLVAESTGKHGKGIVPIAGEPLAEPDAYGADRVFVRMRLQEGPAEPAVDRAVDLLKAAQVPIVDIVVPEACALGAEFVRWEIATAVAGAMLHINPFDEPNVQQAKDATRQLLSAYTSGGRLPVPAPDGRSAGGATLTLSAEARRLLGGSQPDLLLTLLRAGDYFALLAYAGPDPALAAEFDAFRRQVRDRTRAATMFGYGPRYLHSTGQLHKGGPNSGVFVLISTSHTSDLPIPGEPFSFGTLELAQAVGDFASLEATGRRALHVHLPGPDARYVHEVAGALLTALSGRLG